MTTDARPLAVIDIDGVLADVRHRLGYLEGRRKDWDSFFAAAVGDPPYEEGLRLVADLAGAHEVVLLTGRPERCRDDTEAWLARHRVAHDLLVMRPAGNRRPAAEVKVGLLRVLADGRAVAVVVDDDPLVVTALTRAGYPAQLATWGDRDETLFRAQEIEGRS